MKNLLLLAGLILLIGCGSEENEIETETSNAKFEEVLFSSFFGECLGERCVETFKIEEGKLFEDSMDEYPNVNGNSYSWTELSSTQFDLVKDFEEAIPDQLISDNTEVFGQPDAGDWGGLMVSVKKDGENQRWIIDNADSNVPSYLHALSAEIRNKVEILK